MGRKTLVWAIAAAIAADAGVALAQSSKQDRTRIEELTGLKGTFIDAERVFKVTSPRTDVKVSVDGWTMPPFMGLTSWVSFGQTPSAKTMIMG
ncbi:MAG: DUF1259 domain-containing protein, partial [Burkholderiales bacterium]